MESYFLLFKDSFISSLILPVHKGFVFKVMLYFQQHYSIIFMLLLGVLGSSLSGIINWYLGTIILSLRKKYHKLQDEGRKSQITRKILTCCVILFSWVPGIGSMLQIVTGYFKVNLYLFIFSITISNFFYLLYLIVSF